MASRKPSTPKAATRKRKKSAPAESQGVGQNKPVRTPTGPVATGKTTPRDNPQARRQALAQWRRIDMAPLEQAASLRVRPLAQLVPHVLKGMGLDQRRANAEILRVWQQSIDPTITAHAHPTGLRRGTLFVSVDSNVWLSEIVRYRYQEILTRLQHSFGEDLITRISFRAE
jgi:predicted nucleic acid-binding Zn ribbon protein